MIMKNMRTFWAKFENKLISFCGALVLLLSVGSYFQFNGISGYGLTNIAPGVFGDVGPSDEEVTLALVNAGKSDFKVKSVSYCEQYGDGVDPFWQANKSAYYEGEREAIARGIAFQYKYSDFLDMVKCTVTYAPIFKGVNDAPQSDLVTDSMMQTKAMTFVKLKSAGGWVLYFIW